MRMEHPNKFDRKPCYRILEDWSFFEFFFFFGELEGAASSTAPCSPLCPRQSAVSFDDAVSCSRSDIISLLSNKNVD